MQPRSYALLMHACRMRASYRMDVRNTHTYAPATYAYAHTQAYVCKRTDLHPHPHTQTGKCYAGTGRQGGGTADEVEAREVEARAGGAVVGLLGATGATMRRAVVAAKTHERDRAAIGHRYAGAA